VAKLKDAKPDVIYLTSYVNDAVLLTRAFSVQKLDCLCYATAGSGYQDPMYLPMVGGIGNYITMPQSFDTDLNRPIEAEFDAKLMKLHNVHGNPHSSTLYSVVYVIKDVLERAGTTDRPKVRDAIAATNITEGRALIKADEFIRFDSMGRTSELGP